MNLSELKTEQQLKRIIIEELGYVATAGGGLEIDLSSEIAGKILDKRVIAGHSGFEIIFVKLKLDFGNTIWKKDASMRGIERNFINAIAKQRDEKLFVFCSEDGEFWHFVSARSSGSRLELRRFSVTPLNRNRLRTTQDRLALLKINPSDTMQSLIDKIKSAFDVEAVTMDFFRIFAEKFLELTDIIKKSRTKYSYEKKDILDVAQIILNRIIFLKFIEQKGWLDNNKDYLYDKFQPYFENKSSYWDEIIIPLFGLLSNPVRNKKQQLGEIPFLNGGLFGAEPKDLILISIPNSFFQDIFENLLNRFNFTIEESSPSSIEVAVDPEMLGRIFEELVLRMEKVMEKGEAEFERELRRATGSYYTPRVAVFYMCREAIARRLAAQSGIDLNKVRKLIDLAVDELSDREQLEELVMSKIECQGLLRAAENISICDPAVGSGAFLLGALQILVGIRRFLSLKVGEAAANSANFNYTLKEEIIKKNLVGVDILCQAVHLCELRLWLSLAVDYERESSKSIPTLPNLTYKVFQGDSIVDHLASQPLEGFRYFHDFRADEAITQKLNKIRDLKGRYFHETDENKKIKNRQDIAKERLELAINILEHEAPPKISQADLFGKKGFDGKKAEQKMRSDSRRNLIASLKKQLAAKKYDTIGDKFSFAWMADLVEYFADHGRGGFDVVIGNPPYGVRNESMEKGKERYKLGSKDSYGVFMAMAFQDLLKIGGILSYITSDTYQTIKTHKPLRRFILDNAKIFNIIMMPPWLFGATVNTSILITEKSERGRAVGAAGERAVFENAKEREGNELVACDFTRADKNTNELDECLYSLDEPKEIFTTKKAIYKYRQGLIETNSNTPFFVGSQKLFKFMSYPESFIKLESLANVKQGLATADNHYYLRQKENARGSYDIVDYSLVLSEKEISSLSEDEKQNGLDPKKYNGRNFLPYDKGGGADTEEGWLPNYYVPTEYYIDWSQGAIKRMRTLTIGQRDNTNRDQVAAVFRNTDFYFKEGITFSISGQYAPSFRVNSSTVFDVKGSCIFPKVNKYSYFLLGLLGSKLLKYFAKVYIYHTVDFQVDAVKELPVLSDKNKRIEDYIATIINKQKQNLAYDYMSNEQKEIDKLVYEMYGLNKDDIREVETWYARRYPRLARFCDIS